jgi:hypothetical protein
MRAGIESSVEESLQQHESVVMHRRCPIMRQSESTTSMVRDIVKHLNAHGSPEHAAGVQWFFKDGCVVR